MDFISIFFGIATFGIAHFGGDAETRYQAGCFDTLSWYRCNRENFGNIHTDAYMATLRRGRNPHARLVRGRK